ncbi:helix-turn-helix domain-containing protein [Streptomyces tendae]|uniref:helix-turn-helix domain-containing protein n=1 Tax=Streptomyces tendae TaxID=1932 RepID=UPI003787FBB0
METTTRLGNVGQRVAKEVARLRGRTTVRELSARLAKLGRPILPSGITKIEQGQRRVDADDLVALAVALKVTPTRLLMGPPPTEGPDDPRHEDVWEWHPWTDREGVERSPIPILRLLPELAMEPWEAWAWAEGEAPLGEIWRLPEENSTNFAEDEVERFQAENRLPAPRPFLGLGDDLQLAIAKIGDAVTDALDEGLTEEQVTQLVQRAVTGWKKVAANRRANGERLRKVQEADENGSQPS